MKEFKNKKILITGGTGTFGKAFINYLNNLGSNQPSKIYIYARDEHKFHDMQNTNLLRNNSRLLIGDIRDEKRLELATNGIDIVIHAAALKHVPFAEYNPMEAISTNVFGSNNLINACIKNKVKKCMLVSTDKAVNPINLYGGTKLLSDKLFVSANNYVGKKNIKFSVVRYGNVAGSRGSVIPIFKKISLNGKYFPITDPKMTRFWITLSEGVNFVIKSFERMKGGEIFVPIIPSFKITDLAKAINPKNKIKIIGLRPGEKINELMCSSDEASQVIRFKDYFIILPSIKNFAPSRQNYLMNNLNQRGKFVKNNFEFSSGKNKFLSISDLKSKIKKIND